MITVKTTVAFGILGLDEKIRLQYIKLADDYEIKAKEAGIFWSRKDSSAGVAITTQRYYDIKRRNEDDEVQTVPVSKRGN